MALKNKRQCRIQTLRYAGAPVIIPVIQTLIKGGGEGGLPKNLFWPFGPQFGLKIREGGRAPQPPPLDPPLQENLLVQ